MRRKRQANKGVVTTEVEEGKFGVNSAREQWA